MPLLYYKNISTDLMNAANNYMDTDEFMQDIQAVIRQWQTGQKYFTFQTSGTTGSPRKIKFTRDQLIWSARQTLSTFGLNQKDVLYLGLPLNHVAGYMMVIRAFTGGLDIVAETPSGNPFQSPYPVSPTFASFVPQQLFNMLNSGKTEPLDNMNTILVGGGIVSGTLKQMISALDTPVYQSYGMTETLTHVALRKLNGPDSSDCYYPLAGIRFEVDNNSCLVVHTPLTSKPVYTHDLVRLYPDNSFEFLGRVDNMINSGGEKINPDILEYKLENLVYRFWGKARFFLYGHPDDKLGEHLELAVESPGLTAQSADFLEACKKVLKKHEIPKFIRFFNNFEYTTLGKINKQKTLEKSQDQ